METFEQIDGLKKKLATTVESKRANTRERLAYKKATPVTDPTRFGKLLSFWWANSDFKETLRETGLAYAFLRGRRYWVTERKTETAPNANSILAALQAVGVVSASEETVAAWLAEKPSEEERVAYETHLASANEKARVEYQARSAARRKAA